MSTVAVLGATGYAGGHLVTEAAARGHDVVGVARDVSSLTEVDRITARAGSVHDAALVDELAAAADALLVAIPFREVDGTVLGDALPALLAAGAAHGTRIGLVGGAGSLLVAEGGPRLVDTPDFPDAFKGEALAATDALDLLRADTSGADWFYVSPAAGFGAYAPGERTGRYRTSDDVLLTDADGGSTLSGEDLAVAIVDELETPRHHRTRFHVAY